MQSRSRHGGRGPDISNAMDAPAVLALAQTLAANPRTMDRGLLAGKKLGLMTPSELEQSAVEFSSAALALGAHVSVIQPGLDERSSTAQIDATARVLGRLYDAVECQLLPISLTKRLARSAGIPIFASLATDLQTAALAAQLDGDASTEAKRRYILQAALLVTLA